MTCREFDRFLAEYVAEELPPDVQKEFERHLAECAPCVDYLRTYRETIRLGKLAYTGTRDAVVNDVPEELVQAILAARGKKAAH